MEKKIPKNIRQIGNVSDNPKIYVEDYVDIYFEQLCEKVKDKPVGAFLIGELLRQDEQDYVFVNGAIQIHEIEIEGNEISIGEKSWKKGCEECKRFFEGKIILGWFLLAPGMPFELNYNLMKVHEKLFGKKSRLFIQKDIDEKEETYYMYKYNDLMEIGGHYIYYEKNADMQDYMIAKRRDNGVTPSEAYEDTAAKSFRSVITRNENTKKQSQKRTSFSYVFSVILVLMVVAVGITYLDDYENMKNFSAFVTETVSGDSVEENGLQEDESEQLENEINIIEENQAAAIPTQENVVDEVVQESVPQGDDGAMETSELVAEYTTPDEGYETYTVQKGDTLVGISTKFYQEAGRVDDICSVNGLDVNDYIYAGQVLLLP